MRRLSDQRLITLTLNYETTLNASEATPERVAPHLRLATTARGRGWMIEVLGKTVRRAHFSDIKPQQKTTGKAGAFLGSKAILEGRKEEGEEAISGDRVFSKGVVHGGELRGRNSPVTREEWLPDCLRVG